MNGFAASELGGVNVILLRYQVSSKDARALSWATGSAMSGNQMEVWRKEEAARLCIDNVAGNNANLLVSLSITIPISR